MKSLLVGDRLGGILFDIQQERRRQKELLGQGKFPFDCDDVNISDHEKLPVLAEEFGEVSREVNEMVKTRRREWPKDEDVNLIAQCNSRSIARRKKLLREELIQVAAVCVSWCEGLDAEEEKMESLQSRCQNPDVLLPNSNPGISKTEAPPRFEDGYSCGYSDRQYDQPYNSAKAHKRFAFDCTTPDCNGYKDVGHSAECIRTVRNYCLCSVPFPKVGIVGFTPDGRKVLGVKCKNCLKIIKNVDVQIEGKDNPEPSNPGITHPPGYVFLIFRKDGNLTQESVYQTAETAQRQVELLNSSVSQHAPYYFERYKRETNYTAVVNFVGPPEPNPGIGKPGKPKYCHCRNPVFPFLTRICEHCSMVVV